MRVPNPPGALSRETLFSFTLDRPTQYLPFRTYIYPPLIVSRLRSAIVHAGHGPFTATPCHLGQLLPHNLAATTSILQFTRNSSHSLFYIRKPRSHLLLLPLLHLPLRQTPIPQQQTEERSSISHLRPQPSWLRSTVSPSHALPQCGRSDPVHPAQARLLRASHYATISDY